jgi:spore germination protein YaaH
MKHSVLLACLLFMASFFTACHKSNLQYEDDLNKSYNAWLSFKRSSSDSYRYLVADGSWTGFGWQTVITVTKGNVTQRDYKLTPPPGNTANIPREKLEWTEKDSEINTHTDSPAAPAITLDQVYEKARTEWLLKRKDAKTYFEAKNNGMISNCGYINDNCTDDCFRGINITYIQSL